MSNVEYFVHTANGYDVIGQILFIPASTECVTEYK